MSSGLGNITNLISGTGNACARHKRPKLWPTPRVIDILVASFENAGAFDPTGSVGVMYANRRTYMRSHRMQIFFYITNNFFRSNMSIITFVLYYFRAIQILSKEQTFQHLHSTKWHLQFVIQTMKKMWIKKEIMETNLISGTGNACAWHKRAKLCIACFSNVILFDSVENVGAFDPTGSINVHTFYDY